MFQSIFFWVITWGVSSLTFSLHTYCLLFLYPPFLVYLKMQHDLSFLPCDCHTGLLYLWTTSSVSKFISCSINFLSPNSPLQLPDSMAQVIYHVLQNQEVEEFTKRERRKINLQGLSQDGVGITSGPIAKQQHWS